MLICCAACRAPEETHFSSTIRRNLTPECKRLVPHEVCGRLVSDSIESPSTGTLATEYRLGYVPSSVQGRRHLSIHDSLCLQDLEMRNTPRCWSRLRSRLNNRTNRDYRRSNGDWSIPCKCKRQRRFCRLIDSSKV